MDISNENKIGVNELLKKYENKEDIYIPRKVNNIKNIVKKEDLTEKKDLNIKNKEEIKDIDKIIFGLNDKKQPIYIPESSRYLNTLVLGTKGSGKTTGVLPLLLEQDFQNNNYGATIIVSKNEVAYKLYALAKQYKRDVVILKPSVNNEISNSFLWKADYDYDYVNEYIINYKEAIKKRQIVIIDMEILKHKSDGLKAVAMLLLQLQLDMQDTDITQKKSHFLYIDDGQYYLPFLEYLFSFGDNYNLGIILFLQSRNQLIKNNKDYSAIIDNNIRNILLLNSLNKSDINYYKDRLYEYKQSNQFYNRDTCEILYETINAENKRKCGICNYNDLKTINLNTLNNKAKSFRTKLLKQKRKELEKDILLSIKNKYRESVIDEESLPCDEVSTIDTIEKELISILPEEEFDSKYEDIGEPIPIDLSLIDNNNPLNNIKKDKLEIDNHVSDLKKNIKMDKKETIEFKKEKVKEIIRIKEKNVKRTVSTKIFNNLVQEINYCDDDFDFTFN